MADLSTQQRKNLPKSDFAIPSKAPGPGSYPIPDKSHAINALQRSAGTPQEGTVRRAIQEKFPGLLKG
jgi:hypothetical protein